MQQVCSTPGCRRAADPNVSIPPTLCISCYYRYPTKEEPMPVKECCRPGCKNTVTAFGEYVYCDFHMRYLESMKKRQPNIQERIDAIKTHHHHKFMCAHRNCVDPAINGSDYCSGHATLHEKMELETIVGKPTMPAPYTTRVVRDPVVEANRKMLLDRSTVGIQKYGTTLHGNKLSHRQWLQHALEEALDLANYLQAQIMKIDAEAEDHKHTK